MGLKGAVAGDGLGGLMGLMGGLKRGEWRKAGRDGGDAGCGMLVGLGQRGWLRIRATRFTTLPTCAVAPVEMMENRLLGVLAGLRISGTGYQCLGGSRRYGLVVGLRGFYGWRRRIASGLRRQSR